MNDFIRNALTRLFGESQHTITKEGTFERHKPGILGSVGSRGKPPEQATPTPTRQPTPTPAQRPPSTAGYNVAPPLTGFRGESPEDPIATLIQAAATESGIHPALLAALLFQESSFNPQAVGSSGDQGIAQISPTSHPDVTQEQAFDPEFAIPWAADYLAQSLGQFGDINRAVASYNVGRGGANVQGPEPFGGGPLGQTYLNNVGRNLDLDLINELGLILSPSLLEEY